MNSEAVSLRTQRLAAGAVRITSGLGGMVGSVSERAVEESGW